VGRDNLNIPEVLDYLRGVLAEPGGEDIADDLRNMVEDVFGRIWRHGGSDDDNFSDNDSDNYSSDSTDSRSSSDSEQSLQRAGRNARNQDRLQLHDPLHLLEGELILRSLHTIDDVWPVGDECDCNRYDVLNQCCRVDGFLYFTTKFGETFTEMEHQILGNLDNPLFPPYDNCRFALYRKAAVALDMGMRGQRVKLPNCLMARIRQTYPSLDGKYAGFQA
jgi:hypothetical protein